MQGSPFFSLLPLPLSRHPHHLVSSLSLLQVMRAYAIMVNLCSIAASPLYHIVTVHYSVCRFYCSGEYGVSVSVAGANRSIARYIRWRGTCDKQRVALGGGTDVAFYASVCSSSKPSNCSLTTLPGRQERQLLNPSRSLCDRPSEPSSRKSLSFLSSFYI